jgi:23S rRNA (guanosine2251-2'-O)-methyltransferase
LALQDFYFICIVFLEVIRMAKPEYYYGVHSVESLLNLSLNGLTLFTLKGRDDQRLQRFCSWLNLLGLVCKKPVVTVWKNWQACLFIKVWWLLYVHIQP